jgi:hypothetical protein
MNRVVNSTLLTLVLLIPAGVSAQSDVGVYVTGPDLQTKELEFKVVEGQSVKSGFQVKPESVVQVTQGGNLLVVTEPRNNVDSVKITDGSGKIIELVNTNGDTFSLSGIAPGIYTLDVIVNQPNSNNRAAYETILVILQPGQAPQNPTQIIQQVKIVTDVSITFEGDKPHICYFDPDNKACDPDDEGKCPPGFGMNGNDRCIPQGDCPKGYGRIDDDETGKCFKKDDIKKCPDGSIIHKDDRCPIPLPEPELPICGEGSVPGELCRDDGDDKTCDGPAVPVGDECVLPEDDPILPEEPTEDPVYPDEVDEDESEETDDDGSNGDGSNADNGDSSDDGGSSDGEVFATD